MGGGSDFALAADIVIASEDAQIGTPYSRIWGSYLSGMWIHRLGLSRAKWHGLTGRPLSGLEAAEVELINIAVPFAELESTVWRIAGELASLPASQLAAMKLVINQAYEGMGLASTQALGPILDGLMRNTPDALAFIETAREQGVPAAVAERDAGFGDYRPGARGRAARSGERDRSRAARSRRALSLRARSGHPMPPVRAFGAASYSSTGAASTSPLDASTLTSWEADVDVEHEGSLVVLQVDLVERAGRRRPGRRDRLLLGDLRLRQQIGAVVESRAAAVGGVDRLPLGRSRLMATGGCGPGPGPACGRGGLVVARIGDSGSGERQCGDRRHAGYLGLAWFGHASSFRGVGERRRLTSGDEMTVRVGRKSRPAREPALTHRRD